MIDMEGRLKSLLREAGLPEEKELINRSFSCIFQKEDGSQYRVSGIISGTHIQYDPKNLKMGDSFTLLTVSPITAQMDEKTIAINISFYSASAEYGPGHPEWILMYPPTEERDHKGVCNRWELINVKFKLL